MRHTFSGITLMAGVLACAGALAAEPLGRLFFTPAQRNALDAGNRIGETTSRAPEPRGPHEVRLDGVVTRSDGESTVWVNGRPSDLSPLPHVGVAIGADTASAQIRVPGISGGRRISVGQSLDTRTGVIREAYVPNARVESARVPTANIAGQIEPNRNSQPVSGR